MVKIFPFNILLLEKKLFPIYSASVLLRVLEGELLKEKKFASVGKVILGVPGIESYRGVCCAMDSRS